MRNLRRSGAKSLCALTLLAFLAAPGAGLAQSASAMIPENSRAKSYGSGWDCNEGYRAHGEDCAAIVVPDNAYRTNSSYGNGWRCRRGYREIDETCAAIEIPADAFLNASGDRWTCERGFRKMNEDCAAIKIPVNGYLVDSSYGPGWTCERGYRAVEDACIAVELPANAHLDYSGHDWDCDRPYRRQLLGCRLP